MAVASQYDQRKEAQVGHFDWNCGLSQHYKLTSQMDIFTNTITGQPCNDHRTVVVVIPSAPFPPSVTPGMGTGQTYVLTLYPGPSVSSGALKHSVLKGPAFKSPHHSFHRASPSAMLESRLSRKVSRMLESMWTHRRP